MNWKEIVRIVEEALGIEIDDKVIRNVAVSVICFFVALFVWIFGGWELSAKVAMTVLCAVGAVAVWWLP